ncbi:DUF6286 domain-containing protein [Sciscionella sediminilitoris]|uniref:DUF6286 domain-containing protein n=1 Tax=Sciscionella sediminilitoris TaxID=1445613 RepID=UPI0004DEE17F|nr:DUF6286 domain-containing protein [Sciscionella sp. SE31]
MIRRPRRSIAAALAALILLGVCALLATSTIQLLTGYPPVLGYRQLFGTLHGLHWADATVLIAGCAAAVLGIVLLLAAFLPGAPNALPLRDNESGLRACASKRSLRTTLRTAASGVAGVERAKARCTRKGAHITAYTTHTEDSASFAEEIGAAVQRRIEQLELVTRHPVRVRIRQLRSKR